MLGAGVLVAVIVGTACGSALLMTALVMAGCFMRRRHRDLFGRVRAPRAGPDTTLLCSDVQNSTAL